jgi:CHASE2 domain-containing sensor protein
MGKLVVLELDGDLQALGFRVTLEVRPEHEIHQIKVKGYLPADPDLVDILDYHWQEKYRALVGPLRIKGQRIVYKGSINRRITECRESAYLLRDRFRKWLNAESFRAIDRRLREELNREDTIRLLIRTENHSLQRLPWQEWDFFERYPRAEVALSAMEYERPLRSPTVAPKQDVRILAILGDSHGIDIEVDRKKLEALPDAKVEFLVEPERSQLSNRLWEQPWDILFFAGHSQTYGETGRICINQTDSLSISELKYGLKQAIAQGLQLAIFNSCDGLGLAHELEQLHLPQMIVMREPVPDRVAQEFLKYLLTAFANGKPLYLAVREAREKLQGIEHQFPCATWLPIICQNPVKIPPTWQDLIQPIAVNLPSPQLALLQPSLPSSNSILPINRKQTRPFEQPQPFSLQRILFSILKWKGRRQLLTILLVSVAIATSFLGLRFSGLLEPLELKAFDQMMYLRPVEDPDRRLLIVTINDAEIQKYGQPPTATQLGRSLSDRSLEQLLNRLDEYQPRVIGLDIYRDYSTGSNHPNLAQKLATNNRIIMVCKAGNFANKKTDSIAYPPEISTDSVIARVGFSNFISDQDNIVRRQILSMMTLHVNPDALCTAPYAFSTQLALEYLSGDDIPLTFTETKDFQFGNTVFKRLKQRSGGYQLIDAGGSQVLLNYRSSPTPAEQVTLTDVLEGRINPEKFRDRMILVGVVAKQSPNPDIAADLWATPYGDAPSEQMPGVVVQAHMSSQIISAVLDGRPLLHVGTLKGDATWILMWSIVGGVVGGIVGWQGRSPSSFTKKHPLNHFSLKWVGAIAIASSCLYCSCLLFLIQGQWVPFIPSVLALITTSSIVNVLKSGRHRSSRDLT